MASLEVPEAYSSLLTQCSTLPLLQAHVEAHAKFAVDAVEIVNKMTATDFREFRRGLKLERAGKFAGETWARRFIAVLMPEPMFTVARIANEYKAPFMVAYRRLQEVRPDLLDVSKKRKSPEAGRVTGDGE